MVAHASNASKTGSAKPQRVCDACFVELTKPDKFKAVVTVVHDL
jgi:hypothetical protein